jgi:hypothetical protein
MLTYAQFINEIRPLFAQIDDLRKQPKLAESLAFKTWLHSLNMLIHTIRRLGYRRTGCHVDSRLFTDHNPWSKASAADVFNKALDDTAIELANIISNYDRYGDPKPPIPATPPVEELVVQETKPVVPAFATLPKPGELTWTWVSTSVPFAYWYLAAAAAVALVGAGFQAGELWASRRPAATALQKPIPAAIAPGQAKAPASHK